MKKAVPSQRRLFNSLNRVWSTCKLDHESNTCLKGPVFNDSGFDGFHSEGFLCLVSKDDRMFFLGLDSCFLIGFFRTWMVSYGFG